MTKLNELHWAAARAELWGEELPFLWLRGAMPDCVGISRIPFWLGLYTKIKV